MENFNFLLMGLFLAVIVLIVLSIIIIVKLSGSRAFGGSVSDLKKGYRDEISKSRKETTETVQKQCQNAGRDACAKSDGKHRYAEQTSERTQQAVYGTSMDIEQRLENIRLSMENKITMMTEENNRQLSEMRNTVDEKLQKTLEDRIGRSFRQVSDTLEQVTRGLGEMQNLAAGVGDLKKVLSNVKTRGILGEIQLGAILAQILSPEQYEEKRCGERRK